MGKKVKEYKSGDFIFAKVKGYPAWPARVQKPNGKKYFVYFYGTGETANLPPNMIFDYAENKDKFLTKSVKRRDFNEGVKQIEYDFANNVPLEQVIGVNPEEPMETSANDTANDTINDTANETVDSAIDTTAADDTVADSTATTQNDTAVEDSDDAGALVIDEGKQQQQLKAKKSKPEPAKTPAKEALKTPKARGKARKEEAKTDEDVDMSDSKKEDEIVSRSGRKIRPKRYVDEQTEENSTLPAPAPKKKRGGSPAPEKDKTETKDKAADKNIKHFNAVSQSDLEDMKEPFKPADAEKENILIGYLPNGQYVGVKLFQARPASFKSESSRLQWDKQAASNAITLKMQLEKGHITPQSIIAQLVMDLNLTDEEKATLDKERETEDKKSRVQFLKTEMKLIELDAKIKTCLCLEKADTELCLKLLDELMELNVKPLMLLKHPTCLETVKRMRAYVGNTPSWDLSESAALLFSKQAHRIRRQADELYRNMKELFITPENLSFWEHFSERVMQFKKATMSLNADELLEMVHEPLEMTVPTAHSTKAAVDAANEEEPLLDEEKEPAASKKKSVSAKSKKTANSTPAKIPAKRQASRKQQEDKDTPEDKEESSKQTEQIAAPIEKTTDPETREPEESNITVDNNTESIATEKTSDVTETTAQDSLEVPKDTEPDVLEKESTEVEEKKSEKSDKKSEKSDKKSEKTDKKTEKSDKKSEKSDKKTDKKSNAKKPEANDNKKADDNDKNAEDKNKKMISDKKAEVSDKKAEVSDKKAEVTDKKVEGNDKKAEVSDKKAEGCDKKAEGCDKKAVVSDKKAEVNDNKTEANDKNADADVKSEAVNDRSDKVEKSDANEMSDKSEKEKNSKEKEKQEVDEPRAKRSRGENKKTESPRPRSPAKRKTKS